MLRKTISLLALMLLWGSLAPRTEAQADPRATLAGGPRERFELGVSLVKAAYHAGVAVTDGDARRLAVEELATLADYLETRPEAEPLRQALRLVLRGQGTEAARVDLVESAAALLAARLPPAERWYLEAGLTVARSLLRSYLGDETRLRQELAQVTQLLATAPPDVPARLLQSLRDLARYGRPGAYNVRDLVAIEQTARGALHGLRPSVERFAE